MDDDKWFILETLYRLKNLTAAADELYISQSTLTRRLQQIEEEFGVLIAQRTPRGLSFTDRGIRLACAAQEHLNWRKTLQKQLAEASQVQSIEIGFGSFFETHFLNPIIEESFCYAYPNIETKLFFGISSLLVEKVQKHILNLAFVRGNHYFEGEKLLIHSAPALVLSRTPIEIKDLPNIPRIQFLHDPTVDKVINQWWSENFSVPPKIGLTFSQRNLAMQRIAKGDGYGIFAPFEKPTKKSKLYSVPLLDTNGKTLSHNMWMIYNNSKYLTEGEKTFVNFIKENHAI